MIITVTGNLTSDPELKHVASAGKDVASFTVAETKRRYDKQLQDWVDGDTSFVRCSVWGDQAGRTAEVLVKGQLVIVVGNFKERSFEDRDGGKRTVWEVDVDHVGPSLRAPLKAAALASAGAGQRTSASDPWGAGAPRDAGDPWGQPTNEPPY